MLIRQEEASDFDAIYEVVKEAFSQAEHADGNEQDLVNDLRQGKGYIPELSLVACMDHQIVGYIMFTKAKVGNHVVLALAPLAILPQYQGMGIGTTLIKEGHQIACQLGYDYSVVLGSNTYYPRVGYVRADLYGIEAPFDVAKENFMACSLRKEAVKIKGVLEYAKEFGI